MVTPYLLRSPSLFTGDQLESIESATYAVLAQIGLAVRNDELRERLRRAGVPETDGRYRIEKRRAEAFIAATRQRSGNAFTLEPQPPSNADRPLTAMPGTYQLKEYDSDSGAVVPFTAERIARGTKLVHSYAGEGLVGSNIGLPDDVGGALALVAQYWLAATFSRQGRSPADSQDPAAFQYIFDMAAALGAPIDSRNVYLISPLVIGGESLQIVLDFERHLNRVSLHSMPAAGVTGPVFPGDAYAVAAAEVIGGAILLQDVLDCDVEWTVALFHADFRSMAMVYGSPEFFTMELASRQLDAFLHGRTWSPLMGNIHSLAEAPGAQACAERASIMTAGALLGERFFASLGVLSADEMFSAEQLVYDMEIKDHVQGMVRGLPLSCDTDRCLADTRAALRAGGFVSLDSTLMNFGDLYWHPATLNRTYHG
ncbi:MAG: hypothetical protein GF331_20770, partial [Chitinivibrionales bacterium]|nr:hypothetical protein [Chitinivibrionales bacterium]